MWQYGIASLTLVVASLTVGRTSTRLCTCIVAVNYLINESYVRLTGATDGWIVFTLTDAICAALLTLPLMGRLGAVLAVTYATQLVMHWGYAITTGADAYLYWQSLTAMAWLQLIVLLYGISSDAGRVLCGLRRPVPLASAEDNSSFREEGNSTGSRLREEGRK